VTVLDPLLPLATDIIETCTRLGLTIATAESCTGGLVAAMLTEVAGSSAVVDRGFVTYSNAAKTELLGVAASLIARDGAVSESVARAMVEGALIHSGADLAVAITGIAGPGGGMPDKPVGADLAVAITGIAGPGGGMPDKPVGLVHFAALRRGGDTRYARRVFQDLGRSAIRLAAVREALIMLRDLI
jgi:nicotinamide-nucleotide amidase